MDASDRVRPTSRPDEARLTGIVKRRLDRSTTQCDLLPVSAKDAKLAQSRADSCNLLEISRYHEIISVGRLELDPFDRSAGDERRVFYRAVHGGSGGGHDDVQAVSRRNDGCMG